MLGRNMHLWTPGMSSRIIVVYGDSNSRLWYFRFDCTSYFSIMASLSFATFLVHNIVTARTSEAKIKTKQQNQARAMISSLASLKALLKGDSTCSSC